MLGMSLHNGTPMGPRSTTPPSAPTYAVVSGDCGPRCLYNVHLMRTFTDDREFMAGLSQLEKWVGDVMTLVATELAEVEAHLSKRHGDGRVRRCMPAGYFWLRFGQGNSNLLSKTPFSEDVECVHVDPLRASQSRRFASRARGRSMVTRKMRSCDYVVLIIQQGLAETLVVIAL